MKHDFLLDKFDNFSKGLGKALFEVKEEIEPISFDSISNKDLIYIILKKLLSEGNFNKGEDLLFKTLEENKTMEFYELGQWFYNHLLLQDDSVLNKNNFPREEVYRGLHDLQIFKEEYLIKG